MIGTYEMKLDDKNRLIVPTKLRAELGETFYITVGANLGHRCLTVFTAAGWQRLTDNYNALPLSRRSGANSQIFMKALECNPDKQFRVGLTATLMKYAGFSRNIVMVGKSDLAEIWDVDEYAAFDEETLNPAAIQTSLGEIDI